MSGLEKRPRRGDRPRKKYDFLAWKTAGSFYKRICDFPPFWGPYFAILANFLQNYAKIGRVQQMRGLRPRQSWGRCPQTPAGGSAPWTPVTCSPRHHRCLLIRGLINRPYGALAFNRRGPFYQKYNVLGEFAVEKQSAKFGCARGRGRCFWPRPARTRFFC